MCRCCPRSKNSIVTRVIYAFILLLGTIIACIMLSPGVDQQLKKVGLLRDLSLNSAQELSGVTAEVHYMSKHILAS